MKWEPQVGTVQQWVLRVGSASIAVAKFPNKATYIVQGWAWWDGYKWAALPDIVTTPQEATALALFRLGE